METREVVNQIEQEAKLIQGEASKDRLFSSQKSFSDEAAAQAAFPNSVAKLLEVNGWSSLGAFLADFKLHDYTGAFKPEDTVQPGDYIQIMIPGPGPDNWVRVTKVTVEDKVAEFIVQPCPNPKENKPEQTEHFFTDEARSTFRVELAGKTIKASEIGTNEVVNNHQPQAGDRTLLNTLIAETGWLFYQKIQWKHLTDYLVDV